MENLSRVFKNKKEEQTHEEIEFHYFIQDCVSTTVYQLHKSAWKNAWGGCFKKGGLEPPYQLWSLALIFKSKIVESSHEM